MSNQVFNLKWSDRFRPNKIKDIILPAGFLQQAENLVKDDDTPHLLFTGPAGTGKTTLALAIISESNADYIKFNGSNGSLNLEAVREEIDHFGTSNSLGSGGKTKYILVDEADGLDKRIFKALREAMEAYPRVRFIFTANYLDAFPEPMLSRFDHLVFEFSAEERKEMASKFARRCYDICQENEVECDTNALIQVVQNYYPDHRRILNKLHGYSKRNNKIDMGIMNELSKNVDVLYEAIFRMDMRGIRQWVEDNGDHNTFSMLWKTMETYVPEDLWPEFIIHIGDKQSEVSRAPSLQMCICNAIVHFVTCLKPEHIKQ